MSVTVHHADNRDVLRGMADCSVDSIVTDPPYALVSIGKRFGKPGSAPPSSEGASGVYKRASAGFMGKSWDTGETAFAVEFWAECFRVLKPGGHVVAFSATRTYHRMACAVEDAGFEIRDMVSWNYGSGFPKSHDVSKAIDKHLGLERAKVRIDASQVRNPKATGAGRDGMEGATRPWIDKALAQGFHEAASHEAASHEAASHEAASWSGWGTALKPAFEPVVLARKPLEGTVAANVLRHGTGALNVDACRVGWQSEADAAAAAGFADSRARGTAKQSASIGKESRDGINRYDPNKLVGRWPANIVHDGSEEVEAAFGDAPGQQANISTTAPSPKTSKVYGKMNREGEASADRRYADRGATDFAPLPGQRRGDSGSAARFFYSAKADAEDRMGSKHPTVKPVDLMAWLCRLITPPGGLILDPFAGSGSTGVAAMREGFDCILIEREDEYVADIHRRIAWAKGEGRLTALEKARDISEPQAAGIDLPLFATQGHAQPASQPASRLREIRPRRRIGPTGMTKW